MTIPRLGWGPSGFEDAVPAAHGPDWYSTMGRGVVLDSPHNVFLQFAVSGGIRFSFSPSVPSSASEGS